MSAERSGSLIDYERTACLCDVGQPNYWAAVCVTDTGEDVLWLVCKDELGAEHPLCGSPDQPHEQLGPLALEFVRRITISRRTRTHRCGRPTKAGAPCRTPVARRGDACARHRRPAPAPAHADPADSPSTKGEEIA
jgi:hypothetical protein